MPDTVYNLAGSVVMAALWGVSLVVWLTVHMKLTKPKASFDWRAAAAFMAAVSCLRLFACLSSVGVLTTVNPEHLDSLASTFAALCGIIVAVRLLIELHQATGRRFAPLKRVSARYAVAVTETPNSRS